MMKNTNNTLIPDRSLSGLTMARGWTGDVSDKYDTDAKKIKKIRGNWNMHSKSLRPTGNLTSWLMQMTSITGLGCCEMRWKSFGKTSTDDRNKIYSNEEEASHVLLWHYGAIPCD